MSLFNLFRRNTQVANQNATTDSGLLPFTTLKPVDAALFVEEHQPDMVSVSQKQGNHIEKFLEQNFEWQGYNEGYSHPEADFMDTKLSLIKANFRIAIDKAMDAKRTELGELKLHVIKTAGISSRLQAQLNEKIKLHEVNIHELDTQKILSIEDEGIVSSAVHAYRLGFIKGVEKYQQEKLFAVSTGLFNQ